MFLRKLIYQFHLACNNNVIRSKQKFSNKTSDMISKRKSCFHHYLHQESGSQFCWKAKNQVLQTLNSQNNRRCHYSKYKITTYWQMKSVESFLLRLFLSIISFQNMKIPISWGISLNWWCKIWQSYCIWIWMFFNKLIKNLKSHIKFVDKDLISYTRVGGRKLFEIRPNIYLLQ